MKNAEAVQLLQQAMKGRRVLGVEGVVEVIELKPQRGDRFKRHRAGAMTFTVKLSAKARR